MPAKLYMGRLPPDVTKANVEEHFKGFRLKDVRLMGHFAFAEFESHTDAADAVRDFADRPFMGENIILEFPRESRRRDIYDGRPGPPDGDRGYPSRGGPSAGARKGVKVNIIGIPHSTSWQDLKDYGRIGSSNVVFADVDRNNPGNGVIEFASLPEAQEAIARLAGVDINNTPVKLEIAPDDGDDSFSRRGLDRPYERPRFDDRRRFNDRSGYDDGRDDGRDDRRIDDRRPRREYDRGDDEERDRERVARRLKRLERSRSPIRRRWEDDQYVARR